MPRLRTALVAALVARGAWEGLRAQPPGGDALWNRTNHRGETLTLLEGPAFAVSAALAAGAASGLPSRVRVAAVIATMGAGGFGALDDLGESGKSKGLKGHLGALKKGEVTTGALKIAGIGVSGLAAGALVHSVDRSQRSWIGHQVTVLTSGALIAGFANLFNLLDLRPGRALKAGVIVSGAGMAGSSSGPLVAAAAGSALALLPEDLDEKAMLGDTGANALGALVGTAAAAQLGPAGRIAALAGVVGLTLASEKVSFSKVISETPGLRELDSWGQLPRD